MIRVGVPAVMVVLLAGCGSTVEGEPVAGPQTSTTTTTTRTTTSSSASPPEPSTPPPDDDVPGVVPTTAAPAAGTCDPADPPPVGVTASVEDPRAPKITVALPEGWGTTAGEGSVGAWLTGPDGESATVTITETSAGPAEAFDEYADHAMDQASVSSISVLPGDLCGFSGQKLIGSWAEPPDPGVRFGDRIAHIPSGGTTYLIAVHVEGSGDFDPFDSPLLDDFAVVIP